MGTLTTTSRALALTRDSDDNPLWRVAGLLLRPLHLGLAFPSILYVAAMTVFLFRPPDLFSFYADRIAFGVLVFFVALRTMALRDKIPFFAGLSLPMLGLTGARRVPGASGAVRRTNLEHHRQQIHRSLCAISHRGAGLPRRIATADTLKSSSSLRSPTSCSLPLPSSRTPAHSSFRVSFLTKALVFIPTALAAHFSRRWPTAFR